GVITRAARDQALSTSELRTALDSLRALDQKKFEVLKALTNERTDIEGKLPPSMVAVSKVITAGKQFTEAIAAHSKAAAGLSAAERAISDRQRWQNFIVKACEAFSDAEAKVANERIAKIEKEYQALFGDLVRGGPN